MTRIFLLMMFVVVAMPGFAVTNSPALRYAQLHERELSGDASGALAGYREMLGQVPASDIRLHARIRYRIGVCEQRQGHLEEARRAWRELLASGPGADPLIARTRDNLKLLEHELDRVVVEGKVIDTSDLATLRSLNNTMIVAGEWGDEPFICPDSNGVFRVERKMAGDTGAGARYCLVYAEDPRLPLVGSEVVVEAGDRKPDPSGCPLKKDVSLGPAVPVTGKVVDSHGRPIEKAFVKITGFKAGIPLPFDRIIPPILSSGNGEFLVKGLVPGIRYVLAAEKEGYRMESEMECKALLPSKPSLQNLGVIVMQRLGEISLAGQVVSETGENIEADVAAWSLPPVEREIAKVSTDDEGRFIFYDLRENMVEVRVTSEGCLPKTVTGLKPMGQNIDVVIRRVKMAGGRQQAQALKGKRPTTPPIRLSDNKAWGNRLITGQVGSLGAILSDLRWIRGDADGGGALHERDMSGSVVVLHYASAYLEAALRMRYPKESGVLTMLQRIYADKRVLCVWVLPEDEEEGEASRMALQLYPDLPIAAWIGKDREAAGNIVMGRDGKIRTVCSDLQLFKAVKECVAE